MKTLKKYHSRNGYAWIVIERKGNIALAYGGSVGWEVFEVQIHNGREIGGKWFEPAEYAPSNEQWGVKGYSFASESAARAKFQSLVSDHDHDIYDETTYDEKP
jgi:hypothetical protein